jgi:alkylated DNA repair dioxygenase AlkB
MLRTNLYPGFEPHDLDDRCRFHTGQLPGHLILQGERFEELWTKHPAEQPTGVMYGRTTRMPRYHQAYGRDYRFPGGGAPTLPVPPELLPHLEWATAAIDRGLNGLLLNWYDGAQRHHIGPHRDKTNGLVAGAPIVTISFGEDRTFRLRPWRGRGKGFRDFAATSGSVFLLPFDTNKAWTHEIVHRTRHTGRRISVTLRAFAGEGHR